MAWIKGEDVKGYCIEQRTVCLNCIRPDEKANLKMENLITPGEMDEEDYYFCDRCKERIL